MDVPDPNNSFARPIAHIEDNTGAGDVLYSIDNVSDLTNGRVFYEYLAIEADLTGYANLSGVKISDDFDWHSVMNLKREPVRGI